MEGDIQAGVPEGYHTVTPWLISRDTARLIDFAIEAFDAVDLGRVADDEGRIGHAEFRIGDSVVMAFDAKPAWPDTPGFLRLYVADADETHRRAIAAGAESVTDVTHLFWGDRVGRIRDPLGNLWWIQTRVEEVDEAEMGRRMGDPAWLERLTYVQSSLAFPEDRR